MSVSVIMTCHNEERYIEQALRSVVAQTAFEKVREVIVVNDGSQDNSRIVLERLAGEIATLKIVETPGLGPAAARNRALMEAKSEFIAILDGDDYWTPEKLARQLPIFEQDPHIGLVYGDFVDFSRDDASDARTITVRRYRPDSLHHLRDYFVHDAPIVPSAAIIRRAVFADVGLFDEKLRTGEDTEFCLRLAEKWRFCYVPGAFTCKRRRAGQLTERLHLLLPSAELVTQRFGRRHPELAFLCGRRMARYHVKVSADFALGGEGRTALHHALTAIGLAPSFWRTWANLLLLLTPAPVTRLLYGGAKRIYHSLRQSIVAL
jgi:glycosyltransferase involved in cell wall biosynthesis